MNQTSSTEWQQISKFTIDCPRSKSLQLIGNQKQKFQLIGSQIKKFKIIGNQQQKFQLIGSQIKKLKIIGNQQQKFQLIGSQIKKLKIIGNQQQKFQLIGSQIKKFTIDWNKINNVVIDWQPYQKTDHKKNHSLKIMRNNLTFSSKIEKCSREHKPKYRLKAFIFINSFC